MQPKGRTESRRQRLAHSIRRCVQVLRRRSILFALPVLTLVPSVHLLAQGTQNQQPLEFSRAVRPWEFMDVTGQRAALLGSESGRLEAWVYPLKILRNFHLLFHAEAKPSWYPSISQAP